MDTSEIERKISNLERKVDDLAYDLRRAVDELRSEIYAKSDKYHTHEGSSI